MVLRYTATWTGVGRPPFGTRWMQAPWAVRNAEPETPSSRGVFFGSRPSPPGSGYVGTPCDRIQRENATAPSCRVDDAAGEPPHPTAGRARPTAAAAAAVRVAALTTPNR